VARVNQQVEIIENELVEEASKAFDEAKEKLVENVDKYLSYVTEQWLNDDVKEVVSDVVETVGEAIEDAGEAVQEVAEAIDPTPQEDRVKELESQIDELKSILKDALESKTEEVVPELPVDDKGLTHSPEKAVEKKAVKISKKGGKSIIDNVFKYINN
jgi:predicted HAD superfamily hydrolase